MDTVKPSHPPVMRPLQYGQPSSHVTHRPAMIPKGKGLGRRIGLGVPKVL